MPSGYWTLLDAAKHSSNTLKRGVVETIIQESPILEMIPFETITGNAIEIDVESTLPTVEFRAVNEGYSQSWGSDSKRFFGVAILGGEVFFDNFLLKVKADKINAKAKQFTKFAKAMSRRWDKEFFDGDGTGDGFKGLNTLIDEGLGQKLIQASGGGALTLAKLDEAKDLLRSQAYADALLMNRRLRRKITALARETYSGFSLIDIGTDVFGRQVTLYDGVPIRIVGDDADRAALLDFDEDPGDATSDTASIYMIAFGTDENVYGIQGAGGSIEVVDYGETNIPGGVPGHLGRVEWYPGLAIANPYSVVRLYGITNA